MSSFTRTVTSERKRNIHYLESSSPRHYSISVGRLDVISLSLGLTLGRAPSVKKQKYRPF